MCQRCDQFEPAVMSDYIGDLSRLLTRIAIGKLDGVLRTVDTIGPPELAHQCTACSRVFLLKQDSTGDVVWEVQTKT